MFLVILLLTASGERVRVMGSTSAKTGLYPARRIASVVEGKVKGVVITSFFSESRQLPHAKECEVQGHVSAGDRLAAGDAGVFQ